MIVWVVIADEQSAVRDVLRMMLDGEPDSEVVGQAADEAEAVHQALWQRPDVMVTDLRMPPVDRLSAIRRLADARALHRGYGLVDPQVTTRPIHRFAGLPPASATEAQQRLTARELEVLRQLARGLSNAEIATALTIEEGTVKAHVSRVLAKLGVRTRVHAVIYAHEHGLAPRRSNPPAPIWIRHSCPGITGASYVEAEAVLGQAFGHARGVGEPEPCVGGHLAQNPE
ncbi:response regulator transcription factor [Nonomuraea sp. NPDC050691]|uniref:response regulator transcription factor n=1 Tax=Nonomuraea sp. NPDC050691 TaxID=3155661 RepID=UPI003403F173